MLHIVNKSPFTAGALRSCLRVAKAGSTILMIEDGIYGALDGTAVSGQVKEAMGEIAICALSNDLEARGVNGKVLDGIKRVDYDGFVDLVTANDGVQSWL